MVTRMSKYDTTVGFEDHYHTNGVITPWNLVAGCTRINLYVIGMETKAVLIGHQSVHSCAQLLHETLRLLAALSCRRRITSFPQCCTCALYVYLLECMSLRGRDALHYPLVSAFPCAVPRQL